MGDFTYIDGGVTTSIGGSDIKCYGIIGNQQFVIGEISSLSVSTVREMSFIHTMGSPDARGIGKGKRGTSGTMTMVSFDRDTLIDYHVAAMKAELSSTGKYGIGGALGYTSWGSTPITNKYPSPYDGNSLYLVQGEPLNFNGLPNLANERINQDLSAGGTGFQSITKDNYDSFVQYPDQLYPFDIIVIGANETGASANFAIRGVQFSSDALSISINDQIIEKPLNFLARGVTRLKAGFGDRFKSTTTITQK